MKSRILIAEDERLTAEDLKEVLLNSGFDVVGIASNAKEVIERTKELYPDLILMDVQMPGEMDGIEAAIVTQSFFENPIPVVFLTAHASDKFAYLRAVEPYKYLNKPYTESELVSCIREMIEAFPKHRRR